MSVFNLKKILRKKELLSLLENLLFQLNIPIDIELVDGTKLISIGEGIVENRYPIEVSGEIIGWVIGEKQSTIVVDLLAFIIKQETEKKELAKELLERYQEIDLFEDISTQLTASLDKQQIAQLVLQEMSQLITSSAGIILLLKQNQNNYEILSEFGDFFDNYPPEINQGIIGDIMLSGRAELINNVRLDPRFSGHKNVNSLICVPLKAKERVLGAMAIGTTSIDIYKAEDLKLMSIFASQTAIAIEKALLYEQSTQVASQAKASAQRLQQALQDLQLAQTQLIQSEKMSSLGQLIAGVAHEINNPVNLICGNLKYITEYTENLLFLLHEYQKYVPIPPSSLQLELDKIDLEFMMADLPKLLDSMKLGSNRIVEIVQSLKNFSRHDETQIKSVNIHNGINGTLMILHHRLKAAHNRSAIEVIKDYGELPLVECYPGQLNQVFMNTLTNSIDALEESTALLDSTSKLKTYKPQITIRTQVLDHQWVVIRIADNGSGMTEEVVRHIYDPFFTTKEIGKGTGLGMAISQQIIVDTHGGIIKCRSQLGQGTEFWIQIPVSHIMETTPKPNYSALMEGTFPDVNNLKDMGDDALTPNTTSYPLPDPDGFISSTTPILQSNDLVLQHIQMIQGLAPENPNIDPISSDNLYTIFQQYPISLKLYATLFSRFYSSQPTDIDTD